MNAAEIERLLRIGMCSPAQHAASGCSTCTVERQARALADSFKGTRIIREMTGPGIAALNLLFYALDERKTQRP